MYAHLCQRNRVHPMNCIGFTLIELAIVLFIITLLLGGVLTPLGQQIIERQAVETRRTLEAARIALVGYALRVSSHPARLPCPDLHGDKMEHADDGLEDRLENGNCATLSGNLPWKTLGLAEGDAWGNRLSYAVAAGWTQSINLPDDAASLLQICQDMHCPIPMPAGAVVLSHGHNGFGAVNVNSGNNLAPSSPDEIENSNRDNRFITHPPRAADSPAGEFDDMLLTLSPDWLRGRLCDPASLCRGN